MDIWNNKKLNSKLDKYLNSQANRPKGFTVIMPKVNKPKLTNAFLDALAKKQGVKRQVIK